MRFTIEKQLSRLKNWRSALTFITSLIAFAVVLPLLPFSPAVANSSTVQFVPPSWVTEHASDANLRILDVRISPFDYFVGHIPKAVHIADNTFRGPNGALPVQYWQPDKLRSLFSEAGVTDDSKVLVYSDGRDFLGATMVAYLLERTGHSDVAILDGGFAGYKAAQLPVTKEFPKYTPGKFTTTDNSSIRVTLNQVKALIGKPGVTFIDPRPPEVFAGEQEIWVRNGHIPGAKNIPWVTFTLGEANFHQLKPLDEIRQILSDRGISSSDDIIVSCSTGREATLQYNVLKHVLGYEKVRIYEGSWTEYSSYPDLPIEVGKGA
ncbi:MAG: sulfurtransferase [Drouetiella hepatica Uher 2000/2452]|jgi:thiosulfate/3-mercaptopyruvate sulfurtransferase|uniref:Sulfurtransferase n=1 Tax=Drouetiella hepatica Uher 2000/2452 TaxID=904376 RepID=A0A951QAK9_9CYAN|nr:sulfurtransferase [Drouetiella hepatica Uher 2000/2452]